MWKWEGKCERKQQITNLFCARKWKKNMHEKPFAREFANEKLWERLWEKMDVKMWRELREKMNVNWKRKWAEKSFAMREKMCGKMRENFYKNTWIFYLKNNRKWVKIKEENNKEKQTENQRKYTRKFKQHHFMKWFLQLKISHKNLTKKLLSKTPVQNNGSNPYLKKGEWPWKISSYDMDLPSRQLSSVSLL